jgi:hypothetical protein
MEVRFFGFRGKKEKALWRFSFWVRREETFHQGAIESLEDLGFNWVLLFFSL